MGALVWEGDAGLTGDQFQLTGGDIVNPGPTVRCAKRF
jgi:hypothetical protein